MAEKPEGLTPPSGRVQAVKDSSCKSSLEPLARCFPHQNLINLFFFSFGDILLSKKTQVTVEPQKNKRQLLGYSSTSTHC